MRKVLLLSALLIPVVFSSTLFAQTEKEVERAKEMIEASHEVYEGEYLPLEKKMHDESTKISLQASEYETLIRRLRNANEDSLERVRRQLDSLRKQVRENERLEAILSNLSMDPEAKTRAIEEASQKVQELEKERSETIQPFHEGMAEIHANYQVESNAFKESLAPLFVDQSDAELTKGLSRHYVSAHFAHNYARILFAKDKKPEISVTLILSNKRQVPKDAEMLAGKFPIIVSREKHMEFLVGRSRLEVSGLSETWTTENLRKAATELINLEALQAVNPLNDDFK